MGSGAAGSDGVDILALLEGICALCRKVAEYIEAEDFTSLANVLDEQQALYDALFSAIEGRREILEGARHRELLQEIQEINRANTRVLQEALREVGGEQRALQKGIKGVKAYTKMPISEDGNFINRQG